MAEKILDSVKVALGVPVTETGYDAELILFTNAALSTLNQLGVGPADGFAISTKDEIWEDLLAGPNILKLNDAKTFVAFTVKLAWDPPPTSFAIAAIQEQIKEASWRINVTREHTDWVDPDPVPVPDPTLVI